MEALDPTDLVSFDREVARAAAELARWRAALANDPDAQAEEDPIEPFRRIAGKSAWDALGRLAPSAVDAPRCEALRRWVHALLQARLGREGEVAWARAALAATGRYDGDRPRLVSWREAWRGLVVARSVAGAEAWLAAAVEVAPGLASVARARAARRQEVARRLDLDHPWAALVAPGAGALRASATRLLASTDDLWRAAAGARGSAGGPAAVLQRVLAREAEEGWPARMNARWFDDAFPGRLGGLRLALPSLPEVYGAASFARALHSFGYAARVAAIPASMPFAIAHEPAFVAAHRWGFAFAALPADPHWQLRALGLGRRSASNQARVLARTALFDARLHAARLLLGDEAAFAPSDLFDELGVRLFGAPLDARLRGAWPAPREDEPARWQAMLEALPFAQSLRERFDVDWFRNPRTWDLLAAEAAGPARAPSEARQSSAESLERSADALARAFEEAVG